MAEPTDRIDVIEDVLIHHRHVARGVCSCGHVTGLGRSIKRHPAEMVAKALGAFDRDAIRIILNLLVASGSVYPEDVAAAADVILALERPAEPGSVTLGPDEVRTARDALVLAQVTPRHPRFDALAARLTNGG